MDRFSEGIKDAQEAKVVDYCEECGGEIYEGQFVWKVGRNIFCCRGCMLTNLGVVMITAGEE
ncbi:hypothetical protein [Brevibacillus sp. HD3.3A]|uniref:hypothetical protein n=1 Tax=Brevibacillus sp. HD3.3A TaxID=2738979 RepID=UPI00156AFDD7|nr:hypothetical protein [Brevibacillus sp. HD3.3A]UED72110.1 hypothetical protein HP435_28810 [Brevibacillus sp. HD3.3A]